MSLGLIGCGLMFASSVCWIIVLIDAFENDVIKGIIGLLFWPYLLYYAIVEFQHDNKWLIVILAFASSAIGLLLRLL